MDPNTSETAKKSKIDFGELRNDTDFVTKSINLEKVSKCSLFSFFYNYFMYLN